MQRVGFVMRVREGQEIEYRRRHEAVFPDLLDAFSRLGVHHYGIFMDGRTLFAQMDVDGDFQETFDRLAAEPANLRWQAHMAGMMEPWPDGSIVRLIPEVFFHA